MRNTTAGPKEQLFVDSGREIWSWLWELPFGDSPGEAQDPGSDPDQGCMRSAKPDEEILSAMSG
jgi:hypothetical protein